MGLFTKSAAQIKVKALKDDLKLVRKELVSSGMAKNSADAGLKELKEIMEAAIVAFFGYQSAKEHLVLADEAIPRLLESIDKNELQELKTGLAALTGDLEQVFHDCLIRKEDPDFASTVIYLKRAQKELESGMAQPEAEQRHGVIMLRSELENVKAVLDDVAQRGAPDFPAFAYYTLHEDRAGLLDMENEQRNVFLTDYYKEHFWDEFLEEAGHFGKKQDVTDLVKGYFIS